MTKKTKIVATISDLKCDKPFLQDLYDAGMNVVRLNTAHQTHEGSLQVIKNVRAISKKIPLLLDTKGPEVRTECGKEIFEIKKNETIQVTGDSKLKSTKKTLYVSYKNFTRDISIGKAILIDDGELELKVIKKARGFLICRAINTSSIKGRKTVNTPGVKINLPSITKKDKDYIEFACKHNLEFIAHSFVRNKTDVLAVQKILDKHKSKAKIIAKIENQEGVDNLDEILDHAYGVMVARGDLGIEISAEKIPRIQRDIINRCVERKRPVIVATQMLHTMIKNPRPTRAEISDIASAIRSRTDAIMLSGETAYGEYPLEAVKTMNRVALEVEKELIIEVKKLPFTKSDLDIPVYLAKAAVRATLKLPIRAIVVDTQSGRTARYISAFRGNKLIYAQCYNEDVMRELALSYGVYPSFIRRTKHTDKFIELALKNLLSTKTFKKNELLLIMAGSFGPSHGPSFIEISTLDNLLKLSISK